MSADPAVTMLDAMNETSKELRPPVTRVAVVGALAVLLLLGGCAALPAGRAPHTSALSSSSSAAPLAPFRSVPDPAVGLPYRTALDGRWRVVFTRMELASVLAQPPELSERGETVTLTFSRGSLLVTHGVGPAEHVVETVPFAVRGRLLRVASGGGAFAVRWAVDGNRLTLTRLASGGGPTAASLTTKPFTMVWEQR